MFGLKKKGVVYQVEGKERGHLEMLVALRGVLDAQFTTILSDVMKREKIEANEKVGFDPKQCAFIHMKSKPTTPQEK